MCGAILPLPQYTFMAWCLVKAQGQLYFYFSTYSSTGTLLLPLPPHNSHTNIFFNTSKNSISLNFLTETERCFWSVIQRRQRPLEWICRWRVFENRMMKEVFGTIRDELKSHNEGLRNLHSLTNIVGAIKSMRMR
jgi:hypothetical protein